MPFKKQCQAIPTLTWRDDHTTIGCGKLNCRVRDGAGCFLSACVHLTIPGGLFMSPPITMKLKTLTSIECECLRCNHSLWSFCFTHSVIQKHPQGVIFVESHKEIRLREHTQVLPYRKRFKSLWRNVFLFLPSSTLVKSSWRNKFHHFSQAQRYALSKIKASGD